jgi:hypothetical protein
MRDTTRSSESERASRADKLAKRALGAFVASILCAILVAIDLDRLARTGAIVVGRESQILTGWTARAVIAAFGVGMVGFFCTGVHALWARGRIDRDS